jgi:hypothetical protein
MAFDVANINLGHCVAFIADNPTSWPNDDRECIGFVEKGKISFSQENHEVEVSVFGLVKQYKTKDTATINLTVPELTLKNLVRALGGDVSAIADASYLGGLFARSGDSEIQICVPNWDTIDFTDLTAVRLEKAYTFWRCRAKDGFEVGLDPKNHQAYEMVFTAQVRNPKGTESDDFTSYKISDGLSAEITADITSSGHGYLMGGV